MFQNGTSSKRRKWECKKNFIIWATNNFKEYNRKGFVINDNIDIAIEVDTDGLHIGQGDMAIEKARKMIGEDKILGVSASNMDQAIDAEEKGADYIGVGAILPS